MSVPLAYPGIILTRATRPLATPAVPLPVLAHRPYPPPVQRGASGRAGVGPRPREDPRMRLRVAGLGPDPDAPLIAVERRAALLPLYKAGTNTSPSGPSLTVSDARRQSRSRGATGR